MPTYVYACSSCNDTYEVDQRITEDALTTCRCGSNGTIKRVIQPIAVMFKGSGFHINDYSSSSAPKAETESKTEAAPETKGDAKAESTAPAEKPATTPSPAPDPSSP